MVRNQSQFVQLGHKHFVASKFALMGLCLCPVHLTILDAKQVKISGTGWKFNAYTKADSCHIYLVTCLES